MDIALTQWINSLAGISPLADHIMIAVTQFGVPLMVLAVALQWWVKNDRSHVRHAALAAGLSFILGLAINQLLLIFIHRVRPYDAGITHLLIAPSADWSFPSDHATATMAVVAAFALQRLPVRTIALFVLAFLVCGSRVYVGTHYLTDVLGGAATGVASAIVIRAIFREGTRLDRIATSIL